jgi:hypothetical protein
LAALEPRLAAHEKPLPAIPRVFLLDAEYATAVVRAEVQWLRSIIADLRAGRVRYPTLEEMLAISAAIGGPSEEGVRRIAAEMNIPTGKERSSPKRRQQARRKAK